MLTSPLIVLFLFLIFLGFTNNVIAATSLTYEYDANGNLISGDGKYYEYNDANQLVRVRHDTQTGPVLAEYFYDYTGQRIKKVENGITTYYIGKHFEKQVDASGSAINTSYYFANGERVAKKDPSGNMYYYHLDHLGGTNAVTDSSGKPVELTRYYPFGEIRLGGSDKYLYTGKEKDKLTDFYYFEARYYNPEFKHFTQADTVSLNLYDPQDLNRYTYVRNNPLKFIDPSGHSFREIWAWLKSLSGSDNKELKAQPQNRQSSATIHEDTNTLNERSASSQSCNSVICAKNNDVADHKQAYFRPYRQEDVADQCGAGISGKMVPDQLGPVNLTLPCHGHDCNYGKLFKSKAVSDTQLAVDTLGENRAHPYMAAGAGFVYFLGLTEIPVAPQSAYWHAQWKAAAQSEHPSFNEAVTGVRVIIDPTGNIGLPW